MTLLVPIVIALIAVVLAWKLLKGLIKTAALVAIVILAAVFMFGGFH